MLLWAAQSIRSWLEHGSREPSCGSLISEWRLYRGLCLYTGGVAQGKPGILPGLWAVLTASLCTTSFDKLGRSQTPCPPSPSTGPGAKQPLLSALSSPPQAFQANLQLRKRGLFEEVSECSWRCLCCQRSLSGSCPFPLKSIHTNSTSNCSMFLKGWSQSIFGLDRGASTDGRRSVPLKTFFFKLLAQANRQKSKWPYCSYLLTDSALGRLKLSLTMWTRHAFLFFSFT